MKFGAYLKDIFGKILIFGLLVILIMAILFLAKTPNEAVLFIALLCLLFGIILVLYDFLRKRTFYNEINSLLGELDQKYLLTEMIKTPNFLDGQILMEILSTTDKSMLDRVNDHSRKMADFRDYIELWVHEIKTPLSSLNLAMRNQDRRSKTYLQAIGNYIDQALFYSKIDTVDKDYLIKEVNLDKIVKEVVRSNKDALIQGDIKINLENLDHTVYSDPKWLYFIINQIVLNAIKYRDKKPAIRIYAECYNNVITLHIHDNGIGIKPSEVKKIFGKGFTGSNDRQKQASTGMGLYIANMLSTDLGHSLTVESEVGKYTEVNISFGKDSHYQIK